VTSSGGETRRLFFALWPDAAVQTALGQLAEACVEHSGGRPVAAEKVHLTLVFLGELGAQDVDKINAVASAAAAEQFTLMLDRLGYWPRNRVLWVGCQMTPPALGRLVGSLRLGLREAGFAVESRAFQAHLTLARKARRAPRQVMQPIRWPVSDFCLVRSRLEPEGSHYEVLQRWPLTAMEGA
jgi:2'-5' RNA ligase